MGHRISSKCISVPPRFAGRCPSRVYVHVQQFVRCSRCGYARREYMAQLQQGTQLYFRSAKAAIPSGALPASATYLFVLSCHRGRAIASPLAFWPTIHSEFRFWRYGEVLHDAIKQCRQRFVNFAFQNRPVCGSTRFLQIEILAAISQNEPGCRRSALNIRSKCPDAVATLTFAGALALLHLHLFVALSEQGVSSK